MLLTLLGLVTAAAVLALWVEHTERNKQDLDLLSRIQRRDEQALSKLYDRYGSLLYTLALRVVSTTEEAEDVLQEVFLQVWNKSSSYIKERGTVYSWITALCRNKAIDRVRSKRYRQQSKEVKLDEAERIADTHATMNPHQTVVLKEYREVVTEAKRKLSEIEAKILDLSYFGGYSQTEISQMLKMPLGTVKTKMRQGMIKLRQAVRGTQKDSGQVRQSPKDAVGQAPAASGDQSRQRPQQQGGRRGRYYGRGRQGPKESGGPPQKGQSPKGQPPDDAGQAPKDPGPGGSTS